MKSVTNGDGTDTFLPVVPGRASRGSLGYVEEEEAEFPGAARSLLEEREAFLGRLEARFFYLAADARGTITSVTSSLASTSTENNEAESNQRRPLGPFMCHTIFS